jgi:LmbE family N-acetylglucosaminyl deacetylase
MADVYVLAHFDDEYLALPLILKGLREGRRQHFIYLADYADARLADRRLEETRSLLHSIGLDPTQAIHVGRDTGVLDGKMHLSLGAAMQAARAALKRFDKIDRLITPAWEGGHPDHDVCAILTARLAGEFGSPAVLQFSLYNGQNLPWRLFRAGARLGRNGAETLVTLTAWEWARFALAVRHFPSQWRTWLGLWPAMFWTFAQRGFAYQTLDPARTNERPHDGPLLYERMYGTPYSELRASVDATT